MEITKITNDSLQKYFEALVYSGYSNQENVDRLLTLSFIEELLTGELSYFITEKDYESIINAIYCLSGDCVVPFPSYNTYDSIYHEVNRDITYRISEDNILRSTETSLLRVV